MNSQFNISRNSYTFWFWKVNIFFKVLNCEIRGIKNSTKDQKHPFPFNFWSMILSLLFHISRILILLEP